jgi:hypothetical protein
MVLKIILVISILLQLAAAFYAIGMIRKSNYNISWILMTIAFLLMAVRRISDFNLIIKTKLDMQDAVISSSISVVTSIFLFAGIYFFRYFSNYKLNLNNSKIKMNLKFFRLCLEPKKMKGIK